MAGKIFAAILPNSLGEAAPKMRENPTKENTMMSKLQLAVVTIVALLLAGFATVQASPTAHASSLRTTATAQVLGGVDLNAFCASRMYSGVPGVEATLVSPSYAKDWRCKDANGLLHTIGFNAACNWMFHISGGVAYAKNAYDPYSIVCLGGSVLQSGGEDFVGYCQSKGYANAVNITYDGMGPVKHSFYAFRCVDASGNVVPETNPPAFNNAACAWKNNATEAYAVSLGIGSTYSLACRT